MKDIEFCAGMGGMAIALQSAGFNLSNKMYEIDEHAYKSLSSNCCVNGGIIHGQPILADVKRLNWDEVSDGQDVRLLAAGLPCQPFSIGGLRKGADDRRDLFPVFFDAVAHMKPHAVLIENVRGLAAGNMREYLNFIIKNLSKPPKSKLTYSVSWKVCNAADYGSPQTRHRIFIVAVRKDIQGKKFIFPEPTHSAKKLLESIELGSYWKRHNNIDRKCPHKLKQMALISHVGKKPWQTVRDVVSSLGKPSRSKNIAINGHYYISGGKLYKGHTGSCIDMPAKTIKAGTNSTPGGENMVVASNGKCRYFTLREMAKIQGLPDIYNLDGSRSKLSKQLGNSVPVDMVKAVGRSLYLHVKH